MDVRINLVLPGIVVRTKTLYVVEGFELEWTGVARMIEGEEEFLMVDRDGTRVIVPVSVLRRATEVA